DHSACRPVHFRTLRRSPMQPRYARVVPIVISLLMFPPRIHAGPEKDQAGNGEPYLTIRFIDDQGKPVPDAQAGIWGIVKDLDGTKPGKWNLRYGGKADANGVVRLVDGVDVFQDRPLIIARHATRGLAAVKRFGEKDRSGVVDITLQPECHVQWRFASSQ